MRSSKPRHRHWFTKRTKYWYGIEDDCVGLGFDGISYAFFRREIMIFHRKQITAIDKRIVYSIKSIQTTYSTGTKRHHRSRDISKQRNNHHINSSTSIYRLEVESHRIRNYHSMVTHTHVDILFCSRKLQPKIGDEVALVDDARNTFDRTVADIETKMNRTKMSAHANAADVDEDDIFPGAAKDMGSGEIVDRASGLFMLLLSLFRSQASFSQGAHPCDARRT